MRYLLILILPAFLFACQQPQSESGAETKAGTETTVKPAEEEPATFEVNFGDRAFEMPGNWITEPVSSKMRAAQFFLKEDPTIQLVFFYFGEEVGSIDANLERWRNEYSDLQNFSEETVGDCNIQMVVAEGVFKKRESMRDTAFTAMPDYVTYAAIIPTGQGPYYFKTVGPKEVLEAQFPAIKSFLTSCHEHVHEH